MNIIKTGFSLARYNPFPRAPKHLIIHPDQTFDAAMSAKPGIENIMEYVGLNRGNNFIIPGSGGWDQGKPIPASYLKYEEENILQGGGEARANSFMLKADELILTGGAWEYCHFTWFTKVVNTWLVNSQKGVIHMPLDAIYPSDKSISEDALRDNRYSFALKTPYTSGILYLNKAIDEYKRNGGDMEFFDNDSLPYYRGVPKAIFYNSALIYQDAEPPVIIINYWDSYKDWPALGS